MSALGYLSAVHGMDKDQMHLSGKCLEVPSPLVLKEAGVTGDYAFTGNRTWTKIKRVAIRCHFFLLC